MTKYTVFILVLGIVFFASQLTAQVDSKTQGPITTTEKKDNTKSEIKTVPAVQSSKTAPGTTTGSTKNTQTNTGTSTQSKPGTVTGSKSTLKTGKMFDASGNLAYSYDELGYIRNAKNRVFCQLTAKGEIIRKRTIVGTVEKGVFCDRFGKEYARIVQEGKVVDAKSKAVGTVKDDGTVLDSKGNKLGTAPGVDKNVAVLIYFYKDVLENATSKPKK